MIARTLFASPTQNTRATLKSGAANPEMREMMLVIEPLIPRLRRYARSLLPDREAADDLVQDCLERAIRAWHTRRSEGDARAWLFTILHNLAMNRLRQRRRRGSHLSLDDAAPHVVARPPSQEDGLRHADLIAALDTLPDDQRSVLLLVSVEDLSYEETARILDIPIGTVMSRLSRARQKLLQAMDGDIPNSKTPHLRRVK